MTENQFKVLRAMTSEIGLMLAERIFRALFFVWPLPRLAAASEHAKSGGAKRKTPKTRTEPLYTENALTLTMNGSCSPSVAQSLSTIQQKNAKEEGHTHTHTTNEKAQNFLCIYFRSWCVCFCTIYFSCSRSLYYALLLLTVDEIKTGNLIRAQEADLLG